MGSFNRWLNANAKAANGTPTDIIHAIGETTNADDGVATDLWDQANATADDDIWTAPTQARTHSFVSASANDSGGVGTLTLSAAPLDTETCTIGTKVYTFQLVLTDVDGNVFIAPNATAAGVLTFAANSTDGDTVTIGTQTYTLEDTLTDSADNVKIGASASDTLDNLVAAINAGAGAGTTYGTGTVANTDATAAAGAGDTIDVTAILAGTVGNLVATTEAGAQSSWGAATLEDGTDSASDTIDNLIAAINLASGAGTTYAASMTAGNTSVLAKVGAGDTMLAFDQAAEAPATTETMTGGSWGAATIDTAGTGARIVRVYGLKTWALSETTEDVVMFGTTANSTVNSYVMINKLEVTTKGASGPNVGLITATAATDGTITASILAGKGNTKMALLGISSLDTFWMKSYYGSIVKAAAATTARIDILVNKSPDDELISFSALQDFGLDTAGTSTVTFDYGDPLEVIGPAIIKIQTSAAAADTTVSGGFKGIRALT